MLKRKAKKIATDRMKSLILFLLLLPCIIYARRVYDDDIYYYDEYSINSSSDENLLLNTVVFILLITVPFIIWGKLSEDKKEMLTVIGQLIFAFIIYGGIAISVYRYITE